MTVREQALQALFLAVRSAVPLATVRRNEAGDIDPGDDGLVSVNDGDPGEPEAQLSPPAYWFEHLAEILVLVGGPSAPARAASLDAIVAAIDAAIFADPTLGNVVHDAEAGSRETDSDAVEGGPAISAARLTVRLEYLAASRFG